MLTTRCMSKNLKLKTFFSSEVELSPFMRARVISNHVHILMKEAEEALSINICKLCISV
jgi:hypothetical protein